MGDSGGDDEAVVVVVDDDVVAVVVVTAGGNGVSSVGSGGVDGGGGAMGHSDAVKVKGTGGPSVSGDDVAVTVAVAGCDVWFEVANSR